MLISSIDVDTSGKFSFEYVRDNGAVSQIIVAGPPSENLHKPKCLYWHNGIASLYSSDHDYHVDTPFTAVPPIVGMSRWQNRSSYCKSNHVQQKTDRSKGIV